MSGQHRIRLSPCRPCILQGKLRTQESRSTENCSPLNVFAGKGLEHPTDTSDLIYLPVDQKKHYLKCYFVTTKFASSNAYMYLVLNGFVKEGQMSLSV